MLHLTDEFHFEPICVKTMGAWGAKGHKFIKNVGRTKDKMSSSFLFQAISMEVQRGNCASVLGTVHRGRKCIFDSFSKMIFK